MKKFLYCDLAKANKFHIIIRFDVLFAHPIGKNLPPIQRKHIDRGTWITVHVTMSLTTFLTAFNTYLYWNPG